MPPPSNPEVQFSFLDGAGSRPPFSLRALRGRDALGGLYEIVLELELDATHRPDDDDLRAVLNARVGLSWTEGTREETHRAGIVRQLERVSQATDGSTFYLAAIVPQLWRASLTSRTRILRETDAQKLFELVCKDAGLNASRDLRWEVSGDVPSIAFLIQYEETDLALLLRVFEHFGLWLRFEHTETGEVVVATDGPAPVEGDPRVLGYERSAGLAFGDVLTAVRSSHSLARAAVVVREHRLEAPASVRAATQLADPKGAGFWSLFGQNAGAGEGPTAANLATVRKEEALCGAARIAGSARTLDLKPGDQVTFEDHPDAWFNAAFHIVAVEYALRQRSDTMPVEDPSERAAVAGFPAGMLTAQTLPAIPGQGARVLQTRFEAIAAATQFRPARVTPKPRIPGIVTGVVTGASPGVSSPVDDDGYYTVILPLDSGAGLQPEGSEQGTASGLRLLMHTGGTGQASHLPLRVGTLVAVAFLLGDPDRPVLLGALPGGDNMSPVKSDNASKGLLRSYSGVIEMEFEDKA